MIRSYPFAMVFVFVRAIFAIPAIEATGELGLVSVVWTSIAAACFIPTFIINWRKLFPSKSAASAAAVKLHVPTVKADPATVIY